MYGRRRCSDGASAASAYQTGGDHRNGTNGSNQIRLRAGREQQSLHFHPHLAVCRYGRAPFRDRPGCTRGPYSPHTVRRKRRSDYRGRKYGFFNLIIIIIIVITVVIALTVIRDRH